MSFNQTKQIKRHGSCKCECTLNSTVCNNKQKWNKDKCNYECKKLVEKEECDKGFISNPSNYNCECDKSCNMKVYLDYKIVNVEKK